MWDEDDFPSGFCASCGREVTATRQNIGIGSYEYWGSICHDDRWIIASPCCQAEVVDEKPEEEPPCDDDTPF